MVARPKSWLLIATLAALAVFLPVAASAAATWALPPPAAGKPSLPDRVGIPWIWTPTAGQAPPGPAAALLAGSGAPLGAISDNADVTVVGADRDTYRFLPVERRARAGEDVLLSADGKLVADSPAALDPANAGVRVLNLSTGHVDVLRAPGRTATQYFPLAWSPDSRQLVVGRVEAVDHVELGVAQLPSGEYQRLALLPSGRDLGLPPRVAFRSDGARVAYQVSDTMTVARPDGGIESTFRVPPGASLAGKGAWLPDGQSLALVDKAGERCRIQVVDATTGVPLASTFPTVGGVTTLRLLGWRPGGEAVVVGYYSDLILVGDHRASGPTDYTGISAVKVLALAPGADKATELLAPPRQVLSIDVADQALTEGRRRHASDAPNWPVRPGWAGFGALVAYLAVVVAWFTVWLGRRVRAWHRQGPPVRRHRATHAG
jgi:hypothetical protein